MVICYPKLIAVFLALYSHKQMNSPLLSHPRAVAAGKLSLSACFVLGVQASVFHNSILKRMGEAHMLHGDCSRREQGLDLMANIDSPLFKAMS